MKVFKPILAAILAITLLAACDSKPHANGQQSSRPAAKVSIVRVEPKPAFATLKVVGSVESKSRVQIETKIQARVERLLVTIGSSVRAGELLAELDTRDISARVRRAQASVDQTAQDFKRYENLLNEGAVAQQSYDDSRAAALSAEANLQEAQSLLNYARIVAPFDGVIAQKHVEAGDMAQPGGPLFTLDQIGQCRFAATIPESSFDRIKVGDSVRIEVSGVDSILSGIVGELSPAVDQATRSFAAKIDIEQNSQLRPGQFGRLLLPISTDAAIHIPSESILRRGQLELVYVATAENRAALRMIRTGRENSGWTEILSGLNSGESVISTGAAKVSDGDWIEILP